MSEILSTRYELGSSSSHRLNAIQQTQVNRITEKIDDGQYSFEEVDCVVCGGEEFRQLSEIDRYGLPHSVVLCPKCGLIQTNPRFDRETYDEFYNEEYQLLHKGDEKSFDWLFDAEYERGSEIHQYLKTVDIGSVDGAHILGIGAGAGGVLAYFRDQGANVVGSDLAEENVRYAREEHGLDFRIGTANDLSLDQDPDIIILSHVVEHFLDPIKTLENVRDLSHSDTLIYIEVPGVRRLMNTYLADFQYMLQIAHTYYFTEQTLTNLVELAGFSKICSNEFVRSVFKPATPSFDWTPDVDVLQSVNRIESIAGVPTLYSIYHTMTEPENIELLDRLGLLNLARELHKIIF